MKPNTALLHYAEDPSDWQGAVNPPIYRTSLFCYDSCQQMIDAGEGKITHYSYTRSGNPTTHVLEEKIALLEHADGAVAFGSGMAAISTCLLAMVRSGDHVLLTNNAYGPVHRLCNHTLARFGVTTSYYKPGDAADLDANIPEHTRVIYLESPGSMTFEITDLRAVSAVARRRGIVTIIDNSWATPLYQNPIDLGIDLVVHTGSKYLGGHSDLVFGVAAGSRELIEQVHRQACELGGIISPEDAYLAIRGLRTLPVRLAQHQRSAMQIAAWLSEQPLVTDVLYPGLESFPGHALAASQMSGYSGVFTFKLQPKSREANMAFVDALLPLFRLGCSWGGFESLVIPAFGLDGSAYRVSIGLEDVEDLQNVLAGALDAYDAHS
ncbi:MAG: PLP-dependent transferase [Chloroflexi bacterium]|nr:PLP-dependent transferase [Chloroflexota bacterium]